MLKWQRDNTIPVESISKMPEEKKKGKIVRGILVNKDIPEYTKEYEKLIENVSKPQNYTKTHKKMKLHLTTEFTENKNIFQERISIVNNLRNYI